MSILRRSVRSEPCHDSAGHLGETKSEMLKEFESECQKALWHVFHVLDRDKTGSVQVSQLKVITSDVGHNLGIKKAEELLNKDDTPPTMNFQDYFHIVKDEVIDKQGTDFEDDLGKVMSDRLTRVLKSCWLMCNFERNHKSVSFSNEHCSMLWRLFNLLSETDETGSVKVPVWLHPEEAVLLFRDFIETTGQLKKEVLVKRFSEEETGGKLLTFGDLLNVFERDFVNDLSRNAISLGLDHLYETYILNILKKGMLWKRGYNVKSWKERWFVLTPSTMKYYVSHKAKELKGQIDFDMECKLEVPVDRPTHKPNRFVVITKKKPYDMSAPDVKSKNEWVSAIEAAMERVGKNQNIQKEAARERCRARAERKRLSEEEDKRRQEEARLLIERQNELDEEKRKRMDDEELLRARLTELETERKRREDAEARFLEEQALRELEQDRLRELERIKQELERLLDEERQAKKDEEIVRNLQARLLEEEFQRREELERLQQQQQEMLSAEREQRESLESERREQEQLLEQARGQLEQLERRQAEAAAKMQETAAKLERADKDRRILLDKQKLWRTPVGLARLVQPKTDPLVTHRGQGAFCNRDFEKKSGWRKSGQQDEEASPNRADEVRKSQATLTLTTRKIKQDEEWLKRRSSDKETTTAVNSEDEVPVLKSQGENVGKNDLEEINGNPETTSNVEIVNIKTEYIPEKEDENNEQDHQDSVTINEENTTNDEKTESLKNTSNDTAPERTDATHDDNFKQGETTLIDDGLKQTDTIPNDDAVEQKETSQNDHKTEPIDETLNDEGIEQSNTVGKDEPFEQSKDTHNNEPACQNDNASKDENLEPEDNTPNGEVPAREESPESINEKLNDETLEEKGKTQNEQNAVQDDNVQNEDNHEQNDNASTPGTDGQATTEARREPSDKQEHIQLDQSSETNGNVQNEDNHEQNDNASTPGTDGQATTEARREPSDKQDNIQLDQSSETNGNVQNEESSEHMDNAPIDETTIGDIEDTAEAAKHDANMPNGEMPSEDSPIHMTNIIASESTNNDDIDVLSKDVNIDKDTNDIVSNVNENMSA